MAMGRRADPDASTEAAPAPVLGNRYELVGLLGSGGMGTVYRARDRELDETVAPKMLTIDLDGRADLYALGTMLFELIAGEPPWRGDSAIAVAAARILRPPPDVRTIRPDVPSAVAELVLRLMARRREDRPASAEVVAAAI